MNTDWPFKDQRNVAVFTSRKIVDEGDWIYYVSHDEDDGAWQFHPHSGMTPESEAVIVSLEAMLKQDATIASLADLPLGWHAWRQTKESDWECAPKKLEF
jgi:hypothetical protein